MDSVFLSKPKSVWITANDLAFAVYDEFPVVPGHVLVMTRRLVATWFDATEAEQVSLMSLVNDVKSILEERLKPKPDGYNVGFNAGEAAGQTVPHLHIHVIPRYRGDVADPRGGIRHVIPGKGNYLAGREQPVATQAGLTLATGNVPYCCKKQWLPPIM
jgi:diadenosine tetraphosphate (Ap4A) HIT family hydrolase